MFGPWYNKKIPMHLVSKAATEEYNRGMKANGKVAIDRKDKVGSTLQIIIQLITKLRSNELSDFDQVWIIFYFSFFHTPTPVRVPLTMITVPPTYVAP